MPDKRKSNEYLSSTSLGSSSSMTKTVPTLTALRFKAQSPSSPDSIMKTDIDRISTMTPKPIRQVSSCFMHQQEDEVKTLPPLHEIPAQDREQALREKLTLCCRPLDFSNPTTQLKLKEAARQALHDIAGYFLSNSHSLSSENVYDDLIVMVRKNVMRILPPPTNTNSETGALDFGDGEYYALDPAWPHLEAVYEVFLRFLESPNFHAAICKRFVDQQFVLGLLELFDSENMREREYLKTVLHRLYGKLVNLRAFIRKEINNIFLRFIYEDDRHNGIAELLEVLSSIINGFQVPLKEEHKLFLRSVLLPLHKSRNLHLFQNQLICCITEFIAKDPSLLSVALKNGLFKFWPKVDSQKELLFLIALEEYVKSCSLEDLQKVAPDVLCKYASCLGSSNFLVIERTLCIWSDDRMLHFLSHFNDLSIPKLLPPLSELKDHWNEKQVREKQVSNLWETVERLARLNENNRSHKPASIRVTRMTTNSAPALKAGSQQEVQSSTSAWISKYGLNSSPTQSTSSATPAQGSNRTSVEKSRMISGRRNANQDAQAQPTRRQPGSERRNSCQPSLGLQSTTKKPHR